MMLSVYPLREYAQVCTRLLFSSFGRHWCKVALHHVQPAPVLPKPLPGCSSVSLEGTGRPRRSIQDGEIMSCGTKRSSCECQVNESQRWRILDHHGSGLTRTHAIWVDIALFGKGQNGTKMLLPREFGKALDGWADC